MQYKFFPHTEEDLKEMLAKAGVSSLDGLYAEVPESIRFKGEYDLPEAKSELEIRQFFGKLGKKNKQLVCFAGAGTYDHYTLNLRPLHSVGNTKHRGTLRVPHFLYSLSGGNFTRHTALHLRISVDDG